MLILQEYPTLRDPKFIENYDFSKALTRVDFGATLSQLDTAVAIMRTGGVMKDMVMLLGRSRAVISTYVANDPHLTELVEEVAEGFLDEVEKLQKTAALQGDLAAQRFILTTLGKGRGYVTRQDHKVEAQTVVNIEGKDALV